MPKALCPPSFYAALKPTLKELGLCPNSLAVLADACYLGATRAACVRGRARFACAAQGPMSPRARRVSLLRWRRLGPCAPASSLLRAARPSPGSSSQFGILFGAVLMLPAVSRLDIALRCRGEPELAQEICERLLRHQGDLPPDDEEESRAVYGCDLVPRPERGARFWRLGRPAGGLTDLFLLPPLRLLCRRRSAEVLLRILRGEITGAMTVDKILRNLKARRGGAPAALRPPPGRLRAW